MSKNIVLCLDGTWNGPNVKDTDGSFTPTNVQLFFQSLMNSVPLSAEDNEHEIVCDDPPQVAKYIHGVGNTNNGLAKVCEGATGLGIVGRIVRGYTYVSRVYAPGDKIYILGFSRGAYTARALGGFIASQGLLDWAQMNLKAGSEASYSAGLNAWYQYKSQLHSGKQSLLNQLASTVCGLQDKLNETLHPAPTLSFITDVNIEAIGVWDTVGALGIPDLHQTTDRVDEFRFADNALSTKVKFGFHAVAIDEQRLDFTPTLWDVRENVIQVLFPGAHADVGGGYPTSESGLANCALLWMIAQLANAGVKFANKPNLKADPTDIQHQPWADTEKNRIFYQKRTQPRHFPPGLALSTRVFQRMAAPSVPVECGSPALYHPQNLFNSYIVLGSSEAAPHVAVVA